MYKVKKRGLIYYVSAFGLFLTCIVKGGRFIIWDCVTAIDNMPFIIYDTRSFFLLFLLLNPSTYKRKQQILGCSSVRK